MFVCMYIYRLFSSFDYSGDFFVRYTGGTGQFKAIVIEGNWFFGKRICCVWKNGDGSDMLFAILLLPSVVENMKFSRQHYNELRN